METVDLRTWAGHFEDTGRRCPKCGKRLIACIGPGPFGDDGTLEFCLDCGEPPESYWSAFDARGDL